MDRCFIELRAKDEVTLGVGHGYQVHKVLDHELNVAVGLVEWLSWVSKFFLVFHIKF